MGGSSSSASAMNTTPAHHANPTEYPNPMYPHVPMPAHMGHAYPTPNPMYNYMPQRVRWHPNFPPAPDPPQAAAAAAAAAAAGLYNTPYTHLLQPVVTLRGFGDEYRRLVEQRHAVENSRGASKSCIERNTFPHKFKLIPREKSDKNEENEAADKCTICLCGKLKLFEFLNQNHYFYYFTEFEEDEDVRRLPCMHLFHVPCVDQWLGLNKRCPICRVDIEAQLNAAAASVTSLRYGNSHMNKSEASPGASGSSGSSGSGNNNNNDNLMQQ